MNIGQTFTSETVVTEAMLACNVGSGDLRVLSTPMMMALMENAAMNCVADSVESGYSTVGGQIESTHLKPTALGKTIRATAELIAIDGRKLSFKIKAEDENGVIGEGTHIRFIVNIEKFMAKCNVG